MKEDIKQRWVEALRSGKYLQAREVLQATSGIVDKDEYGDDIYDEGRGGYCCLGVLCDVFDPTGWQDLYYWGEQSFVPPSMLDAIDLKYEDMRHLAGLNDDEGLSFGEIADYIEREL